MVYALLVLGRHGHPAGLDPGAELDQDPRCGPGEDRVRSRSGAVTGGWDHPMPGHRWRVFADWGALPCAQRPVDAYVLLLHRGRGCLCDGGFVGDPVREGADLGGVDAVPTKVEAVLADLPGVHSAARTHRLFRAPPARGRNCWGHQDHIAIGGTSSGVSSPFRQFDHGVGRRAVDRHRWSWGVGPWSRGNGAEGRGAEGAASGSGAERVAHELVEEVGFLRRRN